MQIDRIDNGFKSYLQNLVRKFMFLTAFTENEVYNALMSLRDTNSTRPDGLATKTLKLASNFIITPLTYIINLSFSQGSFVTLLKMRRLYPSIKIVEKI